MRRKFSSPAVATAFTAALTASGIQTVAAGDVPAQVFDRIVYLDARGLEELRATNMDHYLRAQRILASANQLCGSHAPELEVADLDLRDFSCAPMLLLTSLPPQREIGFRLDHTRYLARVYVTDDPPRVQPAR